MRKQFISFSIIITLVCNHHASAKKKYELNSNWYCANITQVNETGETLSLQGFPLTGWLPATVPGTVLTTLLQNNLVPDPFFGTNLDRIPDIYNTGNKHYTYWFVTDFDETAGNDENVWLNFRGVNYGCDVYLNGHKLTSATHFGMFLRQSYNITKFLSKNGKNRLAVIVYPPDPPGNPNGGQGGDGTIAKSVTHQYVAGWDWIKPIPDRNTGIWDKVTIEKTGPVNLKNPFIITSVPGWRFPGKPQGPAYIKSGIEIENPTDKPVSGILYFNIDNESVSVNVSIHPNSSQLITLPEVCIKNPRLWWPNGYGSPELYHTGFALSNDKKVLYDEEKQVIGIREIEVSWNEHTKSAQVNVNGQNICIKGGNWIVSDAMLRLSEQRYDAEIRFHRDMNLNLIRVWGGALIERPEFYNACDKYGLLVMQDLWMTGDCNGKWLDPLKKDDQWKRRQYPDDHQLFLASFTDQVKMMRNHPSLALWCGGNEITPPEDILNEIQDSLLPVLDPVRYFFPYSNSSEMSLNSIGGNGDGPYTIQPVSYFWEQKSFPFNTEIGSVGTGDYESLARFIPEENMVVPDYESDFVDPVWKYHKDIGYGDYINKYGKPVTIQDFANKAQLVNYDQYRALIEGYSAHQWDWYTGVIIWKTQNPWTALRGQMYDCYLDPNAGLYALRKASESIHVMCNPVNGMVYVVNNSFEAFRDHMLQVRIFDFEGKQKYFNQLLIEAPATASQKYFSVGEVLRELSKTEGIFLQLKLLNMKSETVSDNLYWFPDSSGYYRGLQSMTKAKPDVVARKTGEGRIEVSLNNPGQGPIAFFNRISLVYPQNNKRILPVFYSDNYISLLPGEEKIIELEYDPEAVSISPVVTISGINVTEQVVVISGYN